MTSPEDSKEKVDGEKDVELQSTSTETAETQTTLTGWRLRLLTGGLCICCFLAALDAIIVATALTAIAGDLHSFDKSSWVVSSYLTCYFSFLVIWAKISDLVGRKITLLTAIFLFLVFSGGCGGARTTFQLIILRAFQGIGGAGMFSMVPVITAEMVPPSKYPLYSSIMSVAMALSFLLGPLLGGAISDGTTWRWIFYINLPTAAIGLGLIYLAMPAAFPDLASPRSLLCAPKRVNFLTQVDYPGFVALLAASVLLIVAIEEAGIAFSWDSAVVVVFLVLAGVFFLLFLGWEWSIHRRGDPNTTAQKSVFPWEFVTNRVFMGACLTALLSGIPYTTLVLILPGRFQNLNHHSGLDAGVHLLPYTLAIAIGSSLSGVLLARGWVVPILVFLAAVILQVLGTGLLYSIRPDTSIPARLFGFLLLGGLGVGLSMNTAMLIVPSVVGGKNLSVALGSITQLRILGGALGVSIATTLLNNTLRTSLQPHLPAGAVEVLMQDVASAKMLSAMEQSLVQTALADGYQRQLAMVFGFSAAQLGAVGLLWERTVRRLE